MTETKTQVLKAPENFSKKILSTPEQIMVLAKAYNLPEKIGAAALPNDELWMQLKTAEAAIIGDINDKKKGSPNNLLNIQRYKALHMEDFFRSKGKKASEYRSAYYDGDIEHKMMGEFLQWAEDQQKTYGENWEEQVPQEEWFKMRDLTDEEIEAHNRHLEIKEEALKQHLKNPENKGTKRDILKEALTGSELRKKLRPHFPELTNSQFNFLVSTPSFTNYLIFESTCMLELTVIEGMIKATLCNEEFDLFATLENFIRERETRAIQMVNIILEKYKDNPNFRQSIGLSSQLTEEVKDNKVEDSKKENRTLKPFDKKTLISPDTKSPSPIEIFKWNGGVPNDNFANQFRTPISVR